MVAVAVVVKFVIVRFHQSGRTGLVHRHSTTRRAVIPATVGPARTATPADIGRNRSHPLQRAHAAREQVPKADAAAVATDRLGFLLPAIPEFFS